MPSAPPPPALLPLAPRCRAFLLRHASHKCSCTLGSRHTTACSTTLTFLRTKRRAQTRMKRPQLPLSPVQLARQRSAYDRLTIVLIPLKSMAEAAVGFQQVEVLPRPHVALRCPVSFSFSSSGRALYFATVAQNQYEQ
uniref:Uncharacterized protein n=1 Tax=Haptolina brevifila TaxID=156173 RepID=A0A7S2I4S1_9EUKA